MFLKDFVYIFNLTKVRQDNPKHQSRDKRTMKVFQGPIQALISLLHLKRGSLANSGPIHPTHSVVPTHPKAETLKNPSNCDKKIIRD